MAQNDWWTNLIQIKFAPVIFNVHELSNRPQFPLRNFQIEYESEVQIKYYFKVNIFQWFINFDTSNTTQQNNNMQ